MNTEEKFSEKNAYYSKEYLHKMSEVRKVKVVNSDPSAIGLFGAYGFFWIALSASWMMNMGVFGKVLSEHVDMTQLGFVFLGYLIFTLFMTLGAMETNKVLFFIFVFIDFLPIGKPFGVF